MKLRPLNDWVVVRLDPTGEHEVSGGIILLHPELVRMGTTISVGPGRTYIDGVYKPCEVHPGDRVAFLAAVLDTKQGHQLEKTTGKEYALIREPDILFVVEGGDMRVTKDAASTRD